MRKIQGKLIALILFVPIVLASFGSCETEPPKTGTLMDFIPQQASVIFKIHNFENLRADIAVNSLLSKFENTSPYNFFHEKKELFDNLHPTSPSLLCIKKQNDSLWAFTFISKQNENIFRTDSLQNKTIETLELDGKTFQRTTLDAEIVYSTIIDSVFVASSSQAILLEILKGKTERDKTFKKVFELPTSNGFTALIRGNEIALNDSTKVAFAQWSALDVAIAPESLTATGITLATDSIPQLLSVFEGQVPQPNEVSELVPSDALGALSFTFNDAEAFQQNLRKFRGEKQSAKTSGIFGSVSEVGSMELKNETAIFIKSIDAFMTSDALAQFVSAKSNFRDIEISSFSEPSLFRKAFWPLILSESANFVFQLDRFFVFAESEATAQQLISDFQNNKTLKNTPYFENTAADLSTASSLLFFKMKGEFSETLSALLNLEDSKMEAITFDEFPLAALQFSYDRNFAHVTLSCKEAGAAAKNVSGSVSELFSFELDNAVMGRPQLFPAHNGSGANVTVQDIANRLYLISESGKTLWTKNLDVPILGKIETVEISGNPHLAFVTKDAFYILDRNGKAAKGFPIKFKDEVTQPLSVFDYDNNHNYRFVVVQQKEVLMYDKAGKSVKGFGFDRAKSRIVQAPVHLRMGNKDYIVIAEESGKLHILSRVGKSRIDVSKKFNFSETPITEEDNTFVVITKEKTKERISQNGKITTQKLDVGSHYWFTVNGTTKATLDDNLLRIDGKLVELPLGVYTSPQIFNIHRNNYITLTETQEKKVYVFNEDGTLLNGFPVYGSTAASIGSAGAKRGIYVVTKGDEKSVVLYSSD